MSGVAIIAEILRADKPLAELVAEELTGLVGAEMDKLGPGLMPDCPVFFCIFFSFSSLSNFQNVNLLNKSQIPRSKVQQGSLFFTDCIYTLHLA